MQLFKRDYTLIVDNTKIEDLRVSFRARKTLEPETNKADIAIFNLGKTARGILKEKFATVELHAGYNGVKSLIFLGNSYKVEHRRVGVDWITEIACGDKEDVAREVVLNKSFPAGVLVADVVRALVGALGISKGNLEQSIANGAFSTQGPVTYNNGYVTAGQAVQVLNIIVRGYGYKWSIQDGSFQLLRKDGVLPDPPIELSAANGLVGAPFRMEAGGLSALTLIRPGLRPGRLINITGVDTKLAGRIDAVTYMGDSLGGPWYAEIEASDPLDLDNLLNLPK